MDGGEEKGGVSLRRTGIRARRGRSGFRPKRTAQVHLSKCDARLCLVMLQGRMCVCLGRDSCIERS